MKKVIIEVGQKFNKLTAVKFHHKDKRSRQYWLFRCDCGKEKVIYVDNVKQGISKSCGCIRIKHGMVKTKIYYSWVSMKTRCLNKNCLKYKDYGGRGIKIYDRWLGKDGFQNFYRDMGNKPDGKSLDRIKNAKGYCKENCRWATNKEQQNNKRTSHLLTYKGRTQTMKQWADKVGIKYHTFLARINYYNWSIEKALKTKI